MDNGSLTVNVTRFLFIYHALGIYTSRVSDVVGRVCGQALTESTLEDNLAELESYWEEREFVFRKITVPRG